MSPPGSYALVGPAVALGLEIGCMLGIQEQRLYSRVGTRLGEFQGDRSMAAPSRRGCL